MVNVNAPSPLRLHYDGASRSQSSRNVSGGTHVSSRPVSTSPSRSPSQSVRRMCSQEDVSGAPELCRDGHRSAAEMLNVRWVARMNGPGDGERHGDEEEDGPSPDRPAPELVCRLGVRFD